MYAPPGAASMQHPAMLDSMQPYGSSSGSQSWYAPPGNQTAGNTGGQQAPGLQQMASAYGLLQPHGSQVPQA